MFFTWRETLADWPKVWGPDWRRSFIPHDLSLDSITISGEAAWVWVNINTKAPLPSPLYPRREFIICISASSPLKQNLFQPYSLRKRQQIRNHYQFQKNLNTNLMAISHGLLVNKSHLKIMLKNKEYEYWYAYNWKSILRQVVWLPY